MTRMLQDLIVLDFTRFLPGPLATLIMADYGAEVIKIEDPWQGDPARHTGPRDGEFSSIFGQLNRNKKSVALNFKASRGLEILKELVGQCDVLIEGFRPGVMERLGLGYENLKAVSPRLVYLSLTGYGSQGAYRNRAGHDLNYMSLSGILDLSSPEGEAPLMPSLQVADTGGGLLALGAVMMALFHRERFGTGQYIDLSMLHGLAPWLIYSSSYYRGERKLPRRGEGSITGAFACYNLYRTSDGKYMSLAALEQIFWKNFCEAVDRPQWKEKQYSEEEQEQLINEVSALFSTKTREEWENFFASTDACCEPVLNYDEITEHPLFENQDFFIPPPANSSFPREQLGFPLKFSGDRGEVIQDPPHLGEHTREVISRIGYTSREIDWFRKEGITGEA